MNVKWNAKGGDEVMERNDRRSGGNGEERKGLRVFFFPWKQEFYERV